MCTRFFEPCVKKVLFQPPMYHHNKGQGVCFILLFLYVFICVIYLYLLCVCIFIFVFIFHVITNKYKNNCKYTHTQLLAMLKKTVLFSLFNNKSLHWLFANIGLFKRFVKHKLCHNKKSINRKMNSYKGLCKKMYLSFTCQQLSKLSFFAPEMSNFLILNWGGWLTWTEQLIDCGLLGYSRRKPKRVRTYFFEKLLEFLGFLL